MQSIRCRFAELPRRFRMDVQQIGDRGRVAAAKTALSRNADIMPSMRLSDIESVACTINPVCLVHKPHENLRGIELRQRRVIGVVVAVPRYRHMDEIDTAQAGRGNRVSVDHTGAEIGGLDDVPVTRVAVTEMYSGLDFRWHEAKVPCDALRRPRYDNAIVQRQAAIGAYDLVTNIPLDCQLVMRDRGGNRIDFAR